MSIVKKDKPSDCVQVDFGEHHIRQRLEDGYLSATDMCKANNRKFNDYYRLDSTREFLREYSSMSEYPESQIVEIRKGNSAIYVRGTWVHPDVAIHLAQWLSPKFAVFVSKLVRRYFSGDQTLHREINENKEQMDQIAKLQAEVLTVKEEMENERKLNLSLKDYLEEHKMLETNQTFYIATSAAYSRNKRYKYGGVKDAKDLRSRLSSYNTGRAEGDLFYYVKHIKCHDYHALEQRVGIVLHQYKDKRNGQKEMLHISYPILLEIIEFLADNYDKEIEFINARCRLIIDSTPGPEVHIPEPIDPSSYIEVSVHRDGVSETKVRVDITNWTEEQIFAKIEEIINTCARDTNVAYNFATDKNTIPIEIEWSAMSKQMKAYTGLKANEWRNVTKKWFREVGPQLITFRGIKCAA